MLIHRALTLVEKNKKLNGIDNVIVKESDAVCCGRQKFFDFILTNPLIKSRERNRASYIRASITWN